MKKKVCVLGSGNWGSAIAKIIGNNVITQDDKFEEIVTMYVYEEIVDGRKLTEIINTTHENVKYLPGHRIPENVIAVPDVVEAAKDADILIFIVPHQFVKGICESLKGKIKTTAAGLSLIKGCDHAPGGGLLLISQIITGILSIPVSVLMGANLAHEVADGKFCEATVGSSNLELGVLMQDLLETDYFHISVVDDVETVEMCGALKNVVACAAGFVDGLGLGDNTKAAVIRMGLMEMIKFVQEFFPRGRLVTFFESCGIGDLLTTCYGGRNHKVCEAFAKTNKSIAQLEIDILNGQKLQGPVTAAEVNHMLRDKDMESRFPLFTAVHEICVGNMNATMMVKKLSERSRAR